VLISKIILANKKISLIRIAWPELNSKPSVKKFARNIKNIRKYLASHAIR
jgi:hypothetical protein